MTILTKPSNDKKGEKIPLPLGIVDEQPAPSSSASAPLAEDVESNAVAMQRLRVSASTTAFLFLSALAVMLIGISGGVALYRMYAPAQRSLHFRGMCDIPYYPRNMSVARLYAHPEFIQLNDLYNLLSTLNESSSFSEQPNDDFFREEIELDLSDDESYSKIDVPDFKDGRRGRFMHDFKENLSAIIDTTTKRCFVMPLDRETTLPPKNFFDLMAKMGNGYYNIDTDRIRKNMRVVLPEIPLLSLASQRIANECFDMKVYMLEKYISGVFKRAARILPETGKFAEFSGKGIVEFNILNIVDVADLESARN